MARVIHFEIHAEKPERAIAFYEAVFAWKFQKWNGPIDYWTITTGTEGEPGINGGLVRRMGAAPVEGQAVNAYVCTVQVAALDAYVSKSTAHGGMIALPKMAIPGIGWLAYVKDPEGNILGMMERDAGAK